MFYGLALDPVFLVFIICDGIFQDLLKSIYKLFYYFRSVDQISGQKLLTVT